MLINIFNDQLGLAQIILNKSKWRIIMKYIVYCTTNIVNKFIYVGLHKTENPNIFDGYIGNGINIHEPSDLQHPKTKFQYAVKQYGVKNFIRNTIAIFDTLEEAAMLESEIVNDTFLQRPDVYNMVLGGLVFTDVPVYQYSKEGVFLNEYTSESEAAKAIHRSQTSIWRAIKNKTLCNNYFWTDTKYQVLNISKMHQYEGIHKIPVFQYSLNGEYDCCYESIKEAARVLQVSDSNLGVAIKTGGICNGKHFSTVLYSTYSVAYNKQLKNTPIYQYDLEGNYINEYIGMASAKKALGITSNIYQAIKLNRTAGGFQWSFEKLDKMPPVKPKSGKARKVGQYDKDWNLIKEFKSLAECKREVGSGVQHVITGRDQFHKGLRYKYI